MRSVTERTFETSACAGFGFVLALCDSISAFTAAAVEKNPRAFTYRDVDLRYAVERTLFFRFLNADGLYEWFHDRQDGQMELPIARHKSTLLHPLRAVRGRAGVEYRRVKGLLSRESKASAALGPAPGGAVVRPPVLIHVIHEKFVRYLQPVLTHVKAPYAYLLAAAPDVRRVVQRERLPSVDVLAAEKPKASRPVPLLDHFGELVEWYDRVYAALAELRPQCVVLVEGNAPQDEVVNRACARLGIATVCVQHGWSPIVHNGFRNMTYTRMTVWGQGFAELLRPYNPDQDFVVTGHHLLTAPQESEPTRTRRELGVGFFLQAPGRLIDEHAWSSFLNLIGCTAETFPDRPIVIREHPARPLSGSERDGFARLSNVQIVSPSSGCLAELMPKIALAVSIYSTVILESIAAGVLPLVVNLTSLPSYHPDVARAGAGIEVHDLNAAMAAIRRVLTEDGYAAGFSASMEAFRRRYFDSAPHAAQRIAGHITSFAERP